MRSYDHKKIEKKWQKEWEKSGLYRTKEDAEKRKAYVLDMFPYPSGEGLHVGHPKGYIATDIFSRHARMQGKSVLHPMGWDAFGLPAENYAIKNKVHPRKAVEKNVKRFKEQLKLIGLDYDWDREINTTDPEFYKWTQWIFLKLYEKGLAHESYEPINWCPSCQTGLANEDLEGNACERCGTIVEKRPMRQWILKITDYAERLLNDLEMLPEWQEHIKESQRNWIGKSEGAEIDFPLVDDAKRVVLLHGKGGSATGAWKPWLKEKLEKLGYEVEAPQLPNSDEPNDEEQTDYVQKHCTLDENTVVVGHSFGGLVALRLVERGVKLKRVALVGTPFSGRFMDGKDRPTVSSAIRKGFDFDAIRKRTGFVFLYDTHDHAIPISDGEAYQKALGGYLMKVRAQTSHFNGTIEPDVFLATVPAIRVFTTRPDTLFGATYMVLSPEHAWVTLATDARHSVLANKTDVAKYVKEAGEKDEIERTAEGKEKTGVRLEGIEAINPATGERIPMYVADYVLAHYGTGAIMAVPAHDERDFAFAKKYDIPIKPVIAKRYRGEGENAERPNVETIYRRIVDPIIRDEDGNFYLVKEGEKHVHFAGGGVDEGENEKEALSREITEETGFTDFEIGRRIIPSISYEGFRHTKNKNQTSLGPAYEVILKSAKRVASEVEDGRHELVKVSKADILKTITWAHHRFLFERYLAGDTPYVEEGVLENSGEFDGMTSAEAKRAITEKFGYQKTTYKLRDWVFSRQRYWGEPIPIVHCEKDGIVPVPYDELPVKLPDVEHYEPTGTGESPLAAIDAWVNTTCPKCGGKAKRETNTMPQWAGSSWYYLRYMDPTNADSLVDLDKEKYWAPVDLYVGGAEHATRHLIYARFWHKFLYDIGSVTTLEPFTRLISVGLILAEDGKKMSKRYGNVINPDDIVETYGADTLRVYEMFMGPFTDAIAWKTSSLIGARRFLERVWRMQEKFADAPNADTERALHQTIKKVGEDIANFKFNTAISQMMIFVNTAEEKGITEGQYAAFIQLLAPFAPHIAEDIWHALGKNGSVHVSVWPQFDESKLLSDTVTIVVQINGKVRAQLDMPANSGESEVRAAAEGASGRWLDGKKVIKAIFVANRLINFVVHE